MKKIALICSSILFLFFISTVIAQEADLDELVYLTEEYKPYNYMEDNEQKGISIDLLKLVWKEMGTSEKTISFYPWARAYRLLQLKKNTVLFATAHTEERKDLFKWVCPITSNQYVLFAKKDRGIKINSLDDAKKYQTGTIRDDISENILLNANFERDTIDSVTDISQNIKKIERNRIDLIAYGKDSLLKILKKEGYNDGDYEVVYTLKESEICYAFHKSTSEKIINKFQNSLDKIRKQPVYEKLLKKYF